MAKTTANYHQQNFIGQQHRPIRNNKDTCEIQETIRNKSHYQECGGENTDRTGLLPNTTKSTTNTVPPIRRRKKRTRPNNKIRTFAKTRNNRRRLFRIPRRNHGKKGQNAQKCTRRTETQRQLHKEKTTHAKYGRITKPNLFRTIKKRARPNLDINHRFGLCLRTNETITGNKETLQFCHYGRENQRILPIPKGFSRTSRHTHYFPGENRPNNRPPNTSMVIIVTRGTKEQHTQKLESVLTKLENEGYKASKKKSKFYQKESV